MDENKEVNNEEVKEPVVEEKKEDRPAINYEAELARKNAELARLRTEAEVRNQSKGYDKNDITTWPDNDLKVLKKDPNFAQYHEQAEDILTERRVLAITRKLAEKQKREDSESRVTKEFPESANPESEFSLKMKQVMQEYDLDKTPAGRLAAAKIASAELKTNANKGQDSEAKRIAALKANMVDGDRPKPTDVPADKAKKNKELTDKLMDTKHEGNQVDAVSQILKDRKMDRQSFFGPR